MKIKGQKTNTSLNNTNKNLNNIIENICDKYADTLKRLSNNDEIYKKKLEKK